MIWIGIIDSDLLDNGTRHPNLALMKISGFHKTRGRNVVLLENYDNINDFDKVFVSKVFSKTKIPINIKNHNNLIYGGSGFYWDKAQPLDEEIEHHMPDYSLYDKFIQNKTNNGVNIKYFKDYIDYSIGFTTRGCIRKCPFCINYNKNKVVKWSHINEFYNKNRKYIYLWDDNFLAYHEWDKILLELEEVGRPFQFKQGLDLRLITEDKAKRFSTIKYHGDYTFAFDNINDAEIIKLKLNIWKKYINKQTRLYVLCGFDRSNKYNNNFWKQDLIDTFERIKILMNFGCIPYIMRFEKYEESPYRGMYVNIARWCNQPNFFKKKSFREFCVINGENSATMRYMKHFENDYPYIAEKYYDIKFVK